MGIDEILKVEISSMCQGLALSLELKRKQEMEISSLQRKISDAQTNKSLNNTWDEYTGPIVRRIQEMIKHDPKNDDDLKKEGERFFKTLMLIETLSRTKDPRGDVHAAQRARRMVKLNKELEIIDEQIEAAKAKLAPFIKHLQ